MKPVATAHVVSGNEAYRHDIRTGNHQLVADEPDTYGGKDKGPAPYDYVLSGLGACTAITLRMYAEKKGWDIGQLDVGLSLYKNAEGETLIKRTLHSSADLSDEQWERLLAVAEKTPVTLTLKAGSTITTQRQHAE